MAYVYRHIRLDKNEPFYIGIGSDFSYKRAYEKTRRNKIWKDIVSKTDYEIEILFDELTWEQACEKEKEFILLYGRIDNQSGILTNLTNGGDGTSGAIMSEQWRNKKSNSMIGNSFAKGLKHSKEFIDNKRDMMKGNSYAKGLKHKEETIKLIKEKITGKKRSEDYVQMMRERMKGNSYTKGKKLSEETKKKMSEAKKKYWEERKNK